MSYFSFNSTLCDKVCQRLAAGRRFSPGTLVSSITKKKTDRLTNWVIVKIEQPENNSMDMKK
jgi:hypothetical protein